MSKRDPDFFGEIATPLLAFGNLINLFWTVGLLSEQLHNGFGTGSSIEMGALVMWLTEIVCLPILLVGFIYLILRYRRRYWKWNLLLFLFLIFQFIFCNVILMY